MGEVQAQVPKDDPLMIAWEAYRATESFAVAKKWAETFEVRYCDNEVKVRHPHIDGSLWAMFVAGFKARENAPDAQNPQ
jgi:hypothetical protein